MTDGRQERVRAEVDEEIAFHLALTTLLLVALAVLVAQRSAASASQAEDMRALEQRIDSLIAAVQPAGVPDETKPARTDYARLAVGDRIRLVDLTGRHTDVEGTLTVQGDGNVLLPELGWVDVTGLTRPELESMLA